VGTPEARSELLRRTHPLPLGGSDPVKADSAIPVAKVSKPFRFNDALGEFLKNLVAIDLLSGVILPRFHCAPRTSTEKRVVTPNDCD
jgi:hypothetical protein